ncbi:MAG TPA: hypothetical protein VGX95_16680 [Xanthobacteraceae bacterium]|jgi:hypothetical protein|nr:hypothetical protein [Xanthobacteraceae bacterium]
MRSGQHVGQPLRLPGAALVVALIGALAASGCSSLDTIGSSSPSDSSSGSFTQRVKNLFSSGSASGQDKVAATAPAGTDPNVECPPVTVRSGAATLAVNTPGVEPSATNLRFQASVSQTARECAVSAGNMTMKIGIQGRVILGPAGTPGKVEVPMRLALVREGVEPRTIWTKLYRVPVTLSAGETNVPFVQVEEGMTFPVPSRADLEAYVVYVGFDPNALAPPEKPKQPGKKGRRVRAD